MPSTYWAKGVVILKLRSSRVVRKSMVREKERMRQNNHSKNTPLKYRGINKIT